MPVESTYNEEEIAAKIREHGLDQWYLEDGWLRRKFTTDGWLTTLMLVTTLPASCAKPPGTTPISR